MSNPIEYFSANFLKLYKLAEHHSDKVQEETKDPQTFEEQMMTDDPEVDLDVNDTEDKNADS